MHCLTVVYAPCLRSLRITRKSVVYSFDLFSLCNSGRFVYAASFLCLTALADMWNLRLGLFRNSITLYLLPYSFTAVIVCKTGDIDNNWVS